MKQTLAKLYWQIQSWLRNRGYPPDFDSNQIAIIQKVRPYTNTSNERLHALVESVNYIIDNDIPGAFVECGVYKGGSMMAMALALISKKATDRELFLFDTFAGMPRPGREDIDLEGRPALQTFSRKNPSKSGSAWAHASLESVRKAMASTHYPPDRLHFVEGLVENTIPEKAPEAIALLRLDTDWYSSTKHELEHLFPRVSNRGIVIIDDYGHFQGARKAVTDYFAMNEQRSFLHRIDYTARLIIKGS